MKTSCFLSQMPSIILLLCRFFPCVKFSLCRCRELRNGGKITYLDEIFTFAFIQTCICSEVRKMSVTFIHSDMPLYVLSYLIMAHVSWILKKISVKLREVPDRSYRCK
jgi:hypothetical protein